MGVRTRLASLLIGCVVSSACPTPGAMLTVRVQSGFRAEDEVRFVQASLFEGSVACGSVVAARVAGHAIERSDQAALGRGTLTAGAFEGLAPGTYTVRVQARRPGDGGVDSGPVLVERCVVTSLGSDRVVRVALTTDCLGVTCPAAGGTASFDQCLNGRCVDPRCDLDAPTTSELCCDRAVLGDACDSRPTVCESTMDCETVLACSGARRCEAGVCVEPDEDLCPVDEHCDAALDACVSGAPDGDAGTPDGGSMDGGGDGGLDASLPDAAPAPIDAEPLDATPAFEIDAAALDAPRDAGTDAIVPCTSVPRLLGPERGALTGSIHSVAPGMDPLRPLFRWQSASGCTSYEIEIDDSCAPGASCAFPSPEITERALATTSFRPTSALAVSRSAPVGRRYYWRVRACNGASCSDWSETRYLEVGRTPRDFDGDGRSDLVVGASQQDGTGPNEGGAYVYLGSASGVPSVPSVTLASPTGQPNARFGLSVAAAGDLDADGFADLVVGAPEQDAGARAEGNVYVYLGGAAGIATTPSLTLDNPDHQADGSFGHNVAGAGDVNGDGYADLVVGAYEQDAGAANEGNAFVFFGAPGGVASAPAVTLDNPDNQANGFFGASVASAGDLDADGFSDVIVGAFRQDAGMPDEGRAYVYLGGAGGIAAAPSITLSNPTGEGGALFGVSVGSAGDVNGDGHADVVVGAPRQDADVTDEGTAFVYLGGPSGVSSMPSLTLDHSLGESGASFGWSVAAAGDVNGDGFGDVVVGAHLFDGGATDEGAAFVYHGGASGLSAVAAATLENPENDAGGNHGHSAACAGDANGDGFSDVAVGPPGQSGTAIDEGAAFVYLGGGDGVATVPSSTLRNPIGQSGAAFGSTVGRGT